jgi:hypothetical protein
MTPYSPNLLVHLTTHQLPRVCPSAATLSPVGAAVPPLASCSAPPEYVEYYLN